MCKKTYQKKKIENISKNENDNKLVLLLAIILLLIIFFLVYKIGDYVIGEISSRLYSKELQENVLIIDTEDTESALADSVPDADFVIPEAVDFERLYAVSENTVAWLYDPGMVINYPVAHTVDNDYYLQRNLSGEGSKSGTLFVDYRNKGDFSDRNTIIYGHNMKSGTMFASLMDYNTQGYYEAHPVMYLYVPEKRYKVELMVGYTTDINDTIFQLSASREEQEAGLERAYRLSSFKSNIQPNQDDKLVTFVTCSYAYDDARYVVIGRLVEE